MIYDVIVIGGGPGGYSAAEKAGAAGLETLCIEGRALGGTCLNEGCIPTKTLLYSAKQYIHALGASKYGVTAEHVKIDHSAVIDRKNKVVKTLVSGVGATLQANGVEVIQANGKITGKQAEGYVVEADGERYIGKHLIIATGSTCTVLPIPGLSEGLESGYVMTNREFLDMRELPESLAVLGGGVIGLEMATYAALLGVKVTIIEMLDHIAGSTEQDLVKLLQKSCKKMGMLFELNAKVTEIRDHSVLYEKDGKSIEAAVDRVLLSIGRRPYTDHLGLENIGVTTERGAVLTDETMRTNVPDVYAVGDVNGKIMLAHTAYREADVAVNNILGKADSMQYDAVPAVLYADSCEQSNLKSAGYRTRGFGRFVRQYPAFFLMVLACLLAATFHNMYSYYMIRIVERVGGDSGTMGTSNFLMAVLELPVLFSISRIVKRIRPAILLVIACFGFVLKGILFLRVSSVSGIYWMQLTQMISFALIVSASVYYTEDTIAPEDRVTGQAFMSLLFSGGIVIGSALAGALIDNMGLDAMLIVGTVISAAAGMCAVVSWRMNRRQKDEPHHR